MQCKYTTKSDVWSFGVCLWEILGLASVRPHAHLEDNQVMDILAGQQQESGNDAVCLDKPARCPRDVYDLMRECWRRDPQDRPTFREIHLFLQRKNLGYTPPE